MGIFGDRCLKLELMSQRVVGLARQQPRCFGFAAMLILWLTIKSRHVFEKPETLKDGCYT